MYIVFILNISWDWERLSDLFKVPRDSESLKEKANI